LVKIVCLTRAVAKRWNERRKEGDVCVFCGWYWSRGGEEAGPFKTRSAAVADAYYRFHLNRERPTVFEPEPAPIRLRPRATYNDRARARAA
jgi:hypothetical protein